MITEIDINNTSVDLYSDLPYATIIPLVGFQDIQYVKVVDGYNTIIHINRYVIDKFNIRPRTLRKGDYIIEAPTNSLSDVIRGEIEKYILYLMK